MIRLSIMRVLVTDSETAAFLNVATLEYANLLCVVQPTPLAYAVADGKQDLVETLLARGASLHVKGMRSWTPLHAAARWNNKTMVDLLLAHRAFID